jgi:hypothetical protein
MPADIEWTKLTQKGDVPTPRSGHSLTWVGNYDYILYGGIQDSKNGKISPSGELYKMKLGEFDATWTKEHNHGGDQPLPRTQHIAIATPKKDKIFIFGGHHSPSSRLNDCWYITINKGEVAW